MIPFIGVLIDAAFLWLFISLIFKDHDLFYWMIFRWLVYGALANLLVYFAISGLSADAFLSSLLGAIAYLSVLGWFIWNYYGDKNANRTLITIVSFVGFHLVRSAAFYLLMSRSEAIIDI